MEKPFEIITIEDDESKNRNGVRLGIQIEIAGQASICPFTETYDSYEALEAEIGRLKKGLEDIRMEARSVLSGSEKQSDLKIDPDMEPEKIWAILSGLKEDDRFMEHFNQMEESTRREVAEHVLTHCNIFSGKAAFFSSRYDVETSTIK